MKRSQLISAPVLTIASLLLCLACVAAVMAEGNNPPATEPIANHYNLVPGPEGSLYFIDTITGRTWHGAFHRPGDKERGYVWREINTPLTKPSGNEADDLHAIPAEAKAILENADELELLALDPNHPKKKPVEDFHGWEVLGKKTIDQAERRRLVEAFEKGVAEPHVQPAHCFNPRHGIRVTKGGKSADFVICFECHQVRVYMPGQKEKLFLVSSAPADLFNKILKGAGIKLPVD
jgi:hypothetical protein